MHIPVSIRDASQNLYFHLVILQSPYLLNQRKFRLFNAPESLAVIELCISNRKKKKINPYIVLCLFRNGFPDNQIDKNEFIIPISFLFIICQLTNLLIRIVL